MTTSAQHFFDPAQVQERRSAQRITPKSLIYVAFGSANGGMVLNANDHGFAISMAIPVGEGSFSSLQVRLNGLSTSIDARARMTWTSQSKKRAGIELLDISETQREKIQQWLLLDSERDINLLPGHEEQSEVESSVPFFSETATASASATPIPMADYSLLGRFSGTPPESLGPSTPNAFSSAAENHSAGLLQDFPPLGSDKSLRRNSDFADVALIPRKKPEGLSALAFTLLWIAIPVLVIGAYVARRPLEQAFNRSDAYGKSFSKSAPPAVQNQGVAVTARNDAGTAMLVSARADNQNLHNAASSGNSSGVIETPDLAVQSRPFDSRPDSARETVNTSDARSPNARPTVLPASTNPDLLNSLSFQEARARINPAATARSSPESDAKWNTSATSAAHSVGTATPQAVGTRQPASSGDFGEAHSKSRSDSAVPSDSGVNAGSKISISTGAGVQHGNPSPSSAKVFENVPAGNSATVSNSTPTPGSVANVTAPHEDVNTSPAHPADTHVNPGVNTNQAADVSSVSATANTTTKTVSAATPSYRSAATSRSIVSNDVASPLSTPSSPPTLMQPLHGTLMVARKGDASFLLKLPSESVANDSSTSVRMQRFIIVPKESRWHHHGPIAKVTVGELTSRPLAGNAGAAVRPRAGDTVTVRAFVNKHGDVEDLKPVSGRFALMPRVMRAVRDWQYEPTLVDGKPVESEINVTIEFRPGR